ncbi:unnamed protein product [Paramecium sonneborni]|uniref:Uncharacterized protein n=1 Tax=Paramecium sonneborni TaxID=65129 RepID=A0A8S1QNZ2_9CILI|nr:unnamed protein product [Paramecium sonneborni]
MQKLIFLNNDWSKILGMSIYQGLNQSGCNYSFKVEGIDPIFLNNIQIAFMFYLLLSSFFQQTLCFIDSFLYLIKQTIPITDKPFSIFHIQIKKQSCQSSIKIQQQMRVSNPYLKYITNLLKQNTINLIKQFKQTISLCLLDIRVKNSQLLFQIFIFIFFKEIIEQTQQKSQNFPLISYLALVIVFKQQFQYHSKFESVFSNNKNWYINILIVQKICCFRIIYILQQKCFLFGCFISLKKIDLSLQLDANLFPSRQKHTV